MNRGGVSTEQEYALMIRIPYTDLDVFRKRY